MKQKELAIGIDLGGTQIKGVLINQKGEILSQMVRNTDDKQDQKEGNPGIWKNRVAEIVSELKKQNHKNTPVGISAPGLANADYSCIAYMPGRLQGLEALRWADFLKEENVFVINDAKASLLAESRFGNGKGIRNLILLTLGTGVGGAILIDGRLYSGIMDRAGHFGHNSLNSNEEPGIVGLPGTLEMAIGNATVEKRSLGKYQNTDQLVKAYKKGEPWASLIWLESVRKLALALSSYINILSPELIILGGGIAQAEEALFEPLDTFMEIYEWNRNIFKTPIKKAQFSELSGAVGAAAFVFYQTKNK